MSELTMNYSYADEIREELVDGKTIKMAPKPATEHNTIVVNLSSIFKSYTKLRPCRVFVDTDVRLTERDVFVPDVCVVCDKSKIKPDCIDGAPDLVVEILSPSTVKRDRVYKKMIYEKCGVREYWIVDAKNLFVEVYLHKDGKFELDNVYTIYPLEEFKAGIFDGLIIKIEEVFEDLI